MKRIWTIIGVRDVPGSFKWYQSLFGQPETAPGHVRLRWGLHFGLRLGRSRCVSGRRPLSIYRISNRIHGVAGCRNRSVRLPAPGSQHLRHVGTDWIPGTARLCPHLETRSTSENSCDYLVDFLCAHLGCNRIELNRICRTDLGLREARSRACTKSPFRCLVRLVCRVRDIIV